MKVVSKICMLIACSFVLVSLVGCSKKDDANAKKIAYQKEVRKVSIEECITHMENKYNDKFTFLEEVPTIEERREYATIRETIAHINNGTTRIYLKSEKCPKEKIEVYARYEPIGMSPSGVIKYSDNILYDDNYIVMKYKSSCMELIEGIARESFGECKVIYLSEEIYETLDESTTFEEYIRSGTCYLDVAIILPTTYEVDLYSVDSHKFYNKLVQNKISTGYFITCVCDDGVYNSIRTGRDFFNLKKEQYLWDDCYSMSESFL